MKATGPHRLKDAPGRPGAPHRGRDHAAARQGGLRRLLRALPLEQAVDLPPDIHLEENGQDYLEYWNKLLGVDARPRRSRQPMRAKVLAPDFLDDNYLSTELRVPATLLPTNICSPIATNAIAGNIWDNFSSSSYKELPSVGTVKVRHPLTGAENDFVVPGGGRGFTRPASLVSLWSTGAVPAEQHRRAVRSEPVGRGAAGRVRGIDRADAVAREAPPRTTIFTKPDDPGAGVIDRTQLGVVAVGAERLRAGRR